MDFVLTSFFMGLTVKKKKIFQLSVSEKVGEGLTRNTQDFPPWFKHGKLAKATNGTKDLLSAGIFPISDKLIF
jgi:hypothetical protein